VVCASTHTFSGTQCVDSNLRHLECETGADKCDELPDECSTAVALKQGYVECCLRAESPSYFLLSGSTLSSNRGGNSQLWQCDGDVRGTSGRLDQVKIYVCGALAKSVRAFASLAIDPAVLTSVSTDTGWGGADRGNTLITDEESSAMALTFCNVTADDDGGATEQEPWATADLHMSQFAFYNMLWCGSEPDKASSGDCREEVGEACQSANRVGDADYDEPLMWSSNVADGIANVGALGLAALDLHWDIFEHVRLPLLLVSAVWNAAGVIPL
jgi:hypothetical protein